MATIDASIPLAAGQIGQIQFAPNAQQTMSLMEFGQQMRARQAQAQAQNALRSIFADPSSMGPDGQLNPEAIAKVSAIDPNTGMQLRQQQTMNAVHQSTMQKNRAQMESALLEQNLKKEKFIQDTVRDPALIAYEKAVKSGIPPAQAAQVAQAEYTKGLDIAKQSGMFSEDEQTRMPPSFDYQRVSSRAQSYKDYQAAEEKKRADARSEKQIAEKERHDREMEDSARRRENRMASAVESQTKGWEIKEGTDKDGKPQFVRINKGTGEVKPVEGAVPNRKLNTATEGERKAAMNYTTMKNAEEELTKLSGQGVDKLAFLSTIQRDEHGYMASADRFGRNRALTPEQQVIAQAALQFAEGAGHLKSGARINRETMGIITDLYIPMPGDSPEVIKRKQLARRNDIAAARIGGGRAVEALEEAERGAGDKGSATDFSHLWGR